VAVDPLGIEIEGGPRGRLLVPRSELRRLVDSGHGASVPEAALDSN
jgi:hypothetical protein